MTERNAQLEIRSEGVQRFVEAAERYCTVIDALESFSKVNFLELMDELLPLLYWRARGLPDLEPEDESKLEPRSAIEKNTRQAVEEGWRPTYDQKEWVKREWKPTYDQLAEKLGEDAVYHYVFDPTSRDDHESIPATLADDLADIYHDLREHLEVYKRDTDSDVREAIWQWRFNFTIHWGHHVTAALRAIGWLLRNRMYED